jgi:hypothetical protein
VSQHNLREEVREVVRAVYLNLDCDDQPFKLISFLNLPDEERGSRPW